MVGSKNVRINPWWAAMLLTLRTTELNYYLLILMPKRTFHKFKCTFKVHHLYLNLFFTKWGHFYLVCIYFIFPYFLMPITMLKIYTSNLNGFEFASKLSYLMEPISMYFFNTTYILEIDGILKRG